MSLMSLTTRRAARPVVFALVLLSLAVNILGDWLRDALNPKLR